MRGWQTGQTYTSTSMTYPEQAGSLCTPRLGRAGQRLHIIIGFLLAPWSSLYLQTDLDTFIVRPGYHYTSLHTEILWTPRILAPTVVCPVSSTSAIPSLLRSFARLILLNRFNNFGSLLCCCMVAEKKENLLNMQYCFVTFIAKDFVNL